MSCNIKGRFFKYLSSKNRLWKMIYRDKDVVILLFKEL